MVDTKFRFSQVRDDQLTSQTELEQVKDNNTSNFVASTMNNYALYNSITNKVFGNNFQETSDNTTSSTSSTSFQQKLRLTTGTLPIGTYRIGWYYEWNFSNASQDFRGRVQGDDIIDLMEHRQEPKDPNSDQSNVVSGFAYVTTTSEDTHFIDLDYCSSTGIYTAYIRNAKLEIWRVS